MKSDTYLFEFLIIGLYITSQIQDKLSYAKITNHENDYLDSSEVHENFFSTALLFCPRKASYVETQNRHQCQQLDNKNAREVQRYCLKFSCTQWAIFRVGDLSPKVTTSIFAQEKILILKSVCQFSGFTVHL